MAPIADLYDPRRAFEVRWRDVEYRRDGTESWLARIYEPQGTGPFPALLEVHGGAWNHNDRTQNASIDEALAASGLVVVAIDFHLGTEAPYPASIADTNYATRWLKARAADFNATADGLGAAGFSSGGHMIMLSAMRPNDPWVVEWRALTVALIDELAPKVRQALGLGADALPLARILEGGTWAAGRQIAAELREGGAPPVRIDSDGTVF